MALFQNTINSQEIIAMNDLSRYLSRKEGESCLVIICPTWVSYVEKYVLIKIHFSDVLSYSLSGPFECLISLVDDVTCIPTSPHYEDSLKDSAA